MSDLERVKDLFKQCTQVGWSLRVSKQFSDMIASIESPSVELQEYIINNMAPSKAFYLNKVAPHLLNPILTNSELIHNNYFKYKEFVQKHFANNQVLMNKWLRYAETIRNSKI